MAANQFTHRSNVRKVNSAMESGVKKNVQNAAQLFIDELDITLRGDRSGKQYIVPGGSNRTYRASAPGEPPARPTGDLATSFTYVATSETRYLVGSELKYGLYLEKGTKHMRPRPYFRRTYDEQRQRIKAVLSRPAIERRR